MADEQHIRGTPLWRQAIHSALNADRFDLQDWNAARDAIPDLTKYDDEAGDEFCGHPVQDAFLSLVRRMTA
jgi:putative hemolysin